jgi:hypothetical protein
MSMSRALARGLERVDPLVTADAPRNCFMVSFACTMTPIAECLWREDHGIT